MPITEPHHAPTASDLSGNRHQAARQPKRRTRQHPQLRTQHAFETDGGSPSGPAKAARTPLVDTISSRLAMTPSNAADGSWWFSAQHRWLPIDLERSAPINLTSSPIVMVTPSSASRYHVALVRTARTPPAGSCMAARQWGEQKRSIVQWRSCFSTALWSAIARAMSTGAAHAGAEGALTGMWALFPARNWGLKSTGFQCTLPPPIQYV